MIFIEPLEKFEVPYVLTVGKFDGMHLGHQAIFRQLTVQGQHCRRVAYVFYFEQESHLSPWEERCALLEAAGAEAVARIPAGHRLWSMEPEAFIRSLCAGDMLRGMVVGSNFRFGRGAQGDTALLKQLGGRYGFAVTVVPPVQAEGGNVSSSAVRAALLAGDLALVTQLLGRPYEMSGVVTAGKQLGRTLGFPTANLPPAPEKLLPPEGVYAAIARVDGRSWAAMTNVGRNPTVNGEHLTVESHLIGCDEDLYGRQMSLQWIKRVRGEVRFSSVEELTAQLMRDREHVVSLFLSQNHNEKPRWI